MFAARRFAITQTFQTTDRILTGNNRLRVRVELDGPAQSWTDGKDVFFGATPIDKLGLDELDLMTVLTGMNYHEVAHLLYTPFAGRYHEVIKQRREWAVASNALEDQRIEAHFIERYKPSKKYFVRAVLKTLIEDEDNLPFSWPIVAGRYYLPAGIRHQSAQAMEDEDLRDAFAEVIDEYVTLNPWSQTDAALDLVKRYAELIKKMQKQQGDQGEALVIAVACDLGRGNATGGEPDFEDLDIPDDLRATIIAVQAPQEPESDEDEEGDEEQAPAPGGSESDDEDAEEDQDLAGQVEEALEEAEEQIQPESVERHKAIEEHEDDYRPSTLQEQPRSLTHNNREKPTHELVVAADRIADEMAELQTELDSGWLQGEDHGQRMDPMRAEQADYTGDSNVWKRWDEGVTDALSVEVAILLDCSYSMSGDIYASSGQHYPTTPIAEASRALWALHKGLMSEHQVPVTAWGFSDETHLLIDRFQAPTPEVVLYNYEGGTFIRQGLNYAQEVLDASDRPVKVLFVITDGEFSEDQTHRIDSYPHPIIMIGLNYDVEKRWSADMYRSIIQSKTIKAPMDMVPVVRRAVLALATQHAGRR